MREYLMRFIGGPMMGRGNIHISEELFGWPLPDQLVVLCHDGVDSVAMWDPKNMPDGLPEVITESPNRVIYRKISESELPDGMDSSSSVTRGALYQLEGSQN